MDDAVMRIAADLRLGVALVLQSAILISAAVVVLMWTPLALMASVVVPAVVVIADMLLSMTSCRGHWIQPRFRVILNHHACTDQMAGDQMEHLLYRGRNGGGFWCRMQHAQTLWPHPTFQLQQQKQEWWPGKPSIESR